MQSRYYNPEWGRFINADGLVSTGQGLLAHNIYAYCNNNPVNMHDPTGKITFLAGLLISIVVVAIIIAIIPPQNNTQSGSSIIQSIVDSIPSTSSSKTTTKTNTSSKTTTKTKTETQTKKKSSKDTIIYRYGGTNPSNLTPKQKDNYSGLSFSTIPQAGAAMTTIEAINLTGVVYAVKDSPFHVSIKPVGGTMQNWIDIGPNSVWTTAIKSVVIKWDGTE